MWMLIDLIRATSNHCVCVLCKYVSAEMPQQAWRRHLIWLSSSLQRLTEEEEHRDDNSSRSGWERLAEGTCECGSASTTSLNAPVLVLFPLTAVEGVVCQIFPPRIAAERFLGQCLEAVSSENTELCWESPKRVKKVKQEKNWRNAERG